MHSIPARGRAVPVEIHLGEVALQGVIQSDRRGRGLRARTAQEQLEIVDGGLVDEAGAELDGGVAQKRLTSDSAHRPLSNIRLLLSVLLVGRLAARDCPCGRTR